MSVVAPVRQRLKKMRRLDTQYLSSNKTVCKIKETPNKVHNSLCLIKKRPLQ